MKNYLNNRNFKWITRAYISAMSYKHNSRTKSKVISPTSPIWGFTNERTAYQKNINTTETDSRYGSSWIIDFDFVDDFLDWNIFR